ncbi:MAG: hypothetical protein ACREMH_07920 [Gemmatimonadales bacterium]
MRQRVRVARVGRVAIGPIPVDSPRVMIAPRELEGDALGHDLVIPFGFLRSYVVTFDYPGQRIMLDHPALPPAP